MKNKLLITGLLSLAVLAVGGNEEAKANNKSLVQERSSYYYFKKHYENNPSKPIKYAPQLVRNQTEYISGWMLVGTHRSLVLGKHGWINKSKVYIFRFDSTWYPLTAPYKGSGYDFNYPIKTNIRLMN